MRQNEQEISHGSIRSYVTGFGLSLLLTLTAYLLVHRHVSSYHTAISHEVLKVMITGLALTQLLVQLVFFLHLDKESKPRWNLTVLFFAATVVVIVVFGSVWIMHNLNYHQATQEQIIHYIHSQGDL
jgi:cytochrome o ubiquinol oxidase operon protein cyoD